MGDSHLPLDVARLAFLVDQQTDDGGAVLAGELAHAIESSAFGFTVFEVGEFRMARPPSHCRPASITGDSVESSTNGTVACVAKRDAISSMSMAPLRPT